MRLKDIARRLPEEVWRLFEPILPPGSGVGMVVHPRAITTVSTPCSTCGSRGFLELRGFKETIRLFTRTFRGRPMHHPQHTFDRSQVGTASGLPVRAVPS